MIVALVAVGVSGCGSGAGGGDSGPVDLVAAADATASTTARFSVRAEVPDDWPEDWPSVGLEALTIEGVVDLSQEVSQFQLARLPDDDDADSVEMILDGERIYIRTGRDPWMYTDVPTDEASEAGVQGGVVGPWVSLDELRGSTGLVEVGQDDVRGAAATHYRVTPVADAWITDVWVDEADRVVRWRIELPTSPPTTERTESDGFVSVTGGMTFAPTVIELWDFGVSADIEIPTDAIPAPAE